MARKEARGSRALYWITGLVGFALFGVNIIADRLRLHITAFDRIVNKTDQWMDHISDHTDHANEVYRR